MITMDVIYKKLRKQNKKNFYLYVLCNFVSLLLITSYSSIMYSPTVRNMLPEGGDSRKQVMAIFILACFGCVVFSVYAASLFYRMKAKEFGTMMALGAPKKTLGVMLLKEVTLLCGTSTILATILGVPLAWLIWRLFRLIIVDTEEMILHFNYQALLISFIFIVIVLCSAFVLGILSLRRVNIMDIVHEEHKCEPIRDVKPWFGYLGIVLLLFGAVAGYSSTGIYMSLFSAYPPAWLNLLYVPVFIGLYMILLHTVIRGWRQKKSQRYKGIISRSMMKFQGRQTVNNMLVVAVLLAGCTFGLFYLPIMGSGQKADLKSREYDYAYHYRSDQKVPKKEEIEQMADEYDLGITDWKESDSLLLGLDGMQNIDDEGGKFHYEYRELLMDGRFLSEHDYNKLTGQSVDVPEGTYMAITNQEETGTYYVSTEATKITNMVNRKTLSVTCCGYLHYDMLTGYLGYYVLDDTDYQFISRELTLDWIEYLVYFNVDGNDSYEFADKLFNTFVDSFDQVCEIPNYYDRVGKIAANERGEIYWGDTSEMSQISFEQRDSSEFRRFWTYMPKIKILDQNDFIKNYAVFLMMFMFIAIVCFMASMIICYTRCMTIAINNRYVFEDLRRLGASPAYLKKEVKEQASKVFFVPSVVGMSIMYLLYWMIMYANDGRITSSEIAGLMLCLAFLFVIAFFIWLIYRRTLKKLFNILSCGG